MRHMDRMATLEEGDERVKRALAQAAHIRSGMAAKKNNELRGSARADRVRGEGLGKVGPGDVQLAGRGRTGNSRQSALRGARTEQGQRALAQAGHSPHDDRRRQSLGAVQDARPQVEAKEGIVAAAVSKALSLSMLRPGLFAERPQMRLINVKSEAEESEATKGAHESRALMEHQHQPAKVEVPLRVESSMEQQPPVQALLNQPTIAGAHLNNVEAVRAYLRGYQPLAKRGAVTPKRALGAAEKQESMGSDVLLNFRTGHFGELFLKNAAALYQVAMGYMQLLH